MSAKENFGGIFRMARISGVDLPREKRVEIGLTYIYGIGRTSSARILKEANVDPDTRVRDLTDDEVKRIIVEFATERDCLFVVRKPRQTQEPVKVLRKL